MFLGGETPSRLSVDEDSEAVFGVSSASRNLFKPKTDANTVSKTFLIIFSLSSFVD